MASASASVIDPELHGLSGHESTQSALYKPFEGDLGEQSCVFMTGGPPASMPGVSCVLRRLAEVRSRIPVLLAVPAEGVAPARLLLARHSHVRLVVSNSFPTPSGVARGALDLLNVLGSTAPGLRRRVVWLAPHMLVRRNVDHLCSLSTNASLYAQPRSSRGTRRQLCFDDELSRSSARLCGGCAANDTTTCAREYDDGVLVVDPMAATAFNEEVVAPVAAGAVEPAGGGGGGGSLVAGRAAAVLNALVYRRALFDGRVAPLTAGFVDVLPAASTCAKGGAPRAGWGAALLRYPRDTPPWRARNAARSVCEWRAACGASI